MALQLGFLFRKWEREISTVLESEIIELGVVPGRVEKHGGGEQCYMYQL